MNLDDLYLANGIYPSWIKRCLEKQDKLNNADILLRKEEFHILDCGNGKLTVELYNKNTTQALGIVEMLISPRDYSLTGEFMND